MEITRMEQLEALETLAEFNDRLLKNLPTIISELSGDRQPDTDEYMNTIIEAINWEINVMNGTMDVFNEQNVHIEKEAFNEKVLALNSAISLHSDPAIASAFEDLIYYFEQLGNAAKAVIA